jgi:hypothetical protein
MRVIDWPEDTILVKVSEAVQALQPFNPKGVRFVRSIELTEAEQEQLDGELAEYGIMPPFCQFITVNSELPSWPKFGQAMMEAQRKQQEAAQGRIMVPGK